jgi:hypothetical protein
MLSMIAVVESHAIRSQYIPWYQAYHYVPVLEACFDSSLLVINSVIVSCGNMASEEAACDICAYICIYN